jgi:hypothetical protein
MTGAVVREGVTWARRGLLKRGLHEYPAGRMGMTRAQTQARHGMEGAAIMRGKLMFITGLAAGFVLGSKAGREKYEEIRANAKKVWENPSVQEAAGVAQAQANKLYSESKDKLQSSKLGEKLHANASTTTTTQPLTADDTLAQSNGKTL